MSFNASWTGIRKLLQVLRFKEKTQKNCIAIGCSIIYSATATSSSISRGILELPTIFEPSLNQKTKNIANETLHTGHLHRLHNIHPRRLLCQNLPSGLLSASLASTMVQILHLHNHVHHCRIQHWNILRADICLR